MEQRLVLLRNTPVLPQLPPELAMTQGKFLFVKPRTGNDTANGTTPDKALKSLKRALALATAGQNDVVFLLAESNTAGTTTDYQAATLDWNKDLVHLIGVNAGSLFSPRSRVAFVPAYATASNLFTLSANGCQIRGIEFYAGVDNVSPNGCFKITGQRNKIVGCHLAGMGHATMDIAGAYSLQISGGQENLFDDCTIGQDTITLGAAVNAVIYFAAGATRNFFRKSRVLLYTNHATNAQFIRAAAGSMDRSQYFEDCVFDNAVDSGSTALTQASTIAAGGAPAGGVRLIGETAVFGATDWNSADAGNVRGGGNTVTAGTFGLGVVLTR